MKRLSYGCAVLLTAALGLGSARADVYYVRATAMAGGDGKSWTTAYRFLWRALLAAGPGDEIRVAAGTYKPPAGRDGTFLVDGEVLRGGYPAAGGFIPIPDLYPTILSGDIGVAGDASDNSYHVVWCHGGSIDGFTIKDGNADQDLGDDKSYGGGVYVDGDATISRCTITGNRAMNGGGVGFLSGQADPILFIEDSVIIDNETFGGDAFWGGDGGGVYVEGEYGEMYMNRCSILGNSASNEGGGVYTEMFNGILNTVFSGNYARFQGGGLKIWDWGGVAINCTFANNHSDLQYGGAMVAWTVVLNCIFWGNTGPSGWDPEYCQLAASGGVVEYTDTEGEPFDGPYAGDGNICADPLYVDDLGPDGEAGTVDDDVRLKVGSACRDAGHAVAAVEPYDRDHHDRVQRSKVIGGSLEIDLGAYEHSAPVIERPHFRFHRPGPIRVR